MKARRAGCGVDACGKDAREARVPENTPDGEARSCEPPSCSGDGPSAPSFSCSEEAARLLDARGDAESRRSGRHRRERAALAVFAVLVVAGFIVLTSYISTAGRGLNVAATNIDDVAGDMSGYDVVLFEGTVQPDDAAAADDGDGDDGDDGDGGSEGVDGRGAILLPEASEESSSGDEADEQGRSEQEQEPSAARTGASESDESDAEMTADEARAIYEGKKASVIEVDPASLRDYASGRIVMKDGHTYGFFSLPPDMVSESVMPKTTMTKTTTTTTETSSGATGPVDEKTTTRVKNAYDSVSELFAATDPDSIDPMLVKHIEDILARFESAQVDTVVAFTSDPTPFSAVSGVDAVITFKTRDRFSMSEVIDGTLYFDAPEQGSVGVLMIAPGNVASTKVLAGQEL